MVDYETAVRNLMATEPSIIAVAVIEGKSNIVYSTDNWDISQDIDRVISSWTGQNAQFIMINNVKYSILQMTDERLTATSIRGMGHIVAAKDDERKVIAYVQPDGDMRTAYPETARCLASLSSKTPYLDDSVQLGTTGEGGTAPMSPSSPSVDPVLRAEIESFLEWIKIEDGLAGYIRYYLQNFDPQIISELAKIYNELREIFGV